MAPRQVASGSIHCYPARNLQQTSSPQETLHELTLRIACGSRFHNTTPTAASMSEIRRDLVKFEHVNQELDYHESIEHFRELKPGHSSRTSQNTQRSGADCHDRHARSNTRIIHKPVISPIEAPAKGSGRLLHILTNWVASTSQEAAFGQLRSGCPEELRNLDVSLRIRKRWYCYGLPG